MSTRYYVKAKVRLYTADPSGKVYLEQGENFSEGEKGINKACIEEWKKCDFIAVLGQDGDDGADPELTAAQAAKIDELEAKLKAAEAKVADEEPTEEGETKKETPKLPNGIFNYDPADLEKMEIDDLNILIADTVAPYGVEPKVYERKPAAVKYLSADFKE